MTIPITDCWCFKKEGIFLDDKELTMARMKEE